MPTWPVSLPCYPSDFETQDQESVNRFQPDYGESIERIGSTATPVMMNGTFPLTRTQLDALLDFYRDDCGRGTIPFDYTDLETLTAGSFKFTGPPARRHIGAGVFSVSVSLMRLP